MADSKEIIPDIGFDAGKIFNHLSNNETEKPTKATDLKGALEMSTSRVYLAIGWLARENKITVLKKRNSVRIKLL